MTTLSPRAQAVLDEFGSHTGVTLDQISNLQRVIENSPPLAAQVEAAVSAGHLRHFALLPPGTNAGGTYDGTNKTINLPASILSTPPSPGIHDAAELTFVLGHEIQHGFNHAGTVQAYERFDRDVRTALVTTHDYTNAIGSLIASNRRDEASAEIAGWNALSGMVKTQNPAATFEDFYTASGRSHDFVQRVPGPPVSIEPRPNLRFEPDLTLRATAENIEGMGQNYFDKPGNLARLGHHGQSNYANYYGAYAVSVASQFEANNARPGAAVRMTINMQQLGLSERSMEENGINLGPGTPAPQAYLDSSTTPPSLHHFDHTHTSHTHIPISAQEHAIRHAEQPGVPNRDTHAEANPGMNGLNSADQRLHDQIRRGVEALDAQNGRTFDATSERLTSSLLVLAKERGLDRVDHVLLSIETKDLPAAHNIFLVKGALGDPAAQRTAMETSEAAVKPIEQSHADIERINRQQPAEPTLSNANEQDLSQPTPGMMR